MTDRWPLSVFADEIDPSLEAQVEAMQSCDVGHVEFRSAWGTSVVDLDQQQLDRTADILAAGLIRLRARQSSSLSPPNGDSFLDFSPPKSGRGRKPRCRVGGQ